MGQEQGMISGSVVTRHAPSKMNFRQELDFGLCAPLLIGASDWLSCALVALLHFAFFKWKVHGKDTHVDDLLWLWKRSH